MSKNSLVLLFGSLVIIVSFLGVPSSWKTIIFSILGILIVIVALLLRKDITTGALCLHLTEDKHTDSYRQNGALRSNDNVNTVDSNTEKKDSDEMKEHDTYDTEPKT